jgi:amino-acid N-acetyltransferase
MKIRPAIHRDLPAVRGLLAEGRLPDEDIGSHLATLLVGVAQRAVVAAGALEPLGDACLLRSIVVAAPFRGRHWGLRMSGRLLDLAHRLRIRDAYLLTTTRPEFFAALGFAQVPRETAPAAVRATRQFASLCPASAVLMHMKLGMPGSDSVRGPTTDGESR